MMKELLEQIGKLVQQIQADGEIVATKGYVSRGRVLRKNLQTLKALTVDLREATLIVMAAKQERDHLLGKTKSNYSRHNLNKYWNQKETL